VFVVQQKLKQQQQANNNKMVFGLGHKHETKVEAAPVIVKDTVLETKERVIEKEAIVNTVIDKPVLDQVIEKKNVEVHHKNVVQEIHEQPVRFNDTFAN
jgi:hypothetical protein